MDISKHCILSVLSKNSTEWWSMDNILNGDKKLHSICLDLILLDSQNLIETRPKKGGQSVPKWHEYRITKKGLEAISEQQEIP